MLPSFNLYAGAYVGLLLISIGVLNEMRFQNKIINNKRQ